MTTRKHPRFTTNLLPVHYQIRYSVFNSEGRRKIVVASIVDPMSATTSNADQPIATGHAICAPRDRFNLDLGMHIAVGRAVKKWWWARKILVEAGIESPDLVDTPPDDIRFLGADRYDPMARVGYRPGAHNTE